MMITTAGTSSVGRVTLLWEQGLLPLVSAQLEEIILTPHLWGFLSLLETETLLQILGNETARISHHFSHPLSSLFIVYGNTI